jgi:hypothetical protein
VVKSNAVVQLLNNLKSKDQTVRWFKNRGHVLLETAYIRPDTLTIVTGWLKEHSLPDTLATSLPQSDPGVLADLSKESR